MARLDAFPKRLAKVLNRYKVAVSDSYARLRLERISTAKAERQVSVAIPFFNNWKQSHLALFNILSDPRVGEIVMLDDGSDEANFEKLQKKMEHFRKKLKLYRRETNLGPFANKIHVVELCTSDWAILLDYDNTIGPDYLDALFAIDEWRDDTIYCPGFAAPHFDYRQELDGVLLDFASTGERVRTGHIAPPFLNTGNYLVPRGKYVSVLKPQYKARVVVPDVEFANYIWLQAGNSLKIVPHCQYWHRVLGASTWASAQGASVGIGERIQARLSGLVGIDEGDFKGEFPFTESEWQEARRVF